MTDPFSISFGVVGAISPAIQVCQGAVNYYNSFRDAPEDIARMRTELDSITTTLQLLRHSTEVRHVRPDTKAEVERLIQRVLDGVNELQRKLDDAWTEDPEAAVQVAIEVKETNNERNPRRNRLDAMPRRFKERTVQSMDRIKYHSSRTIDRAKFPFREETIRKLQNIIGIIKSDLGIVMPMLSIDAANGTLDNMDTLHKDLGQIHKDFRVFRKRVSENIDLLRKDLDDLRPEIRLSGGDDRDNSTRLRNDFIGKFEKLQNSVKESQNDLHQTKQELLNEVHEFGARAQLTDRAVGGVHDQLIHSAAQLTEEIRTVEENLGPKLDQVASDVNVWREEMTKNVNETSGAVKALHDDFDQRHQAQEDASFLDWLSPLTTALEEKQNDTYNVRCKQEEAMKQFLQSEEYLQWREGFGNALWCLGGPGVGKTVLASSIVQALQQDRHQEEGLVYIYCEHSEAKKHEPTKYAVKLLCHVVRQLASHRALSSKMLVELRQRFASSKASPSLAECRKAMIAAAKSYSKIFLVIDALDECPDITRDELFEELKNLEAKASVLLTSRCKFPGLYDVKKDHEVAIRALDSDIAEYVKQSTRNFKKFLACITEDKELQEKIVRGIVKKANGMFLLARLHLNALVLKPNDYAIEMTLDSLPDSLDPTYDEVIKRIEERDPFLASTARKLITWISLAERPLSIEELQYALAIEPEDTHLVSSRVLRRDACFEICPEILELQREDTLGFVHYSAQEHFVKRFDSGQSLVALSCLSYLSFEPFNQWPVHRDDTFDVDEGIESQMIAHPFLEYACCHWGHHAKYATDPNVCNVALAFCERQLNVLFSIGVIAASFERKPSEYLYYRNLDKIFFPHGEHGSIGLWIAAYFAWYELAVELLSRRTKARNVDHSFRLAVSNHHKEIVMLLLKHGANVNAKDLDGQTALHCAAKRGDEAYAVDLLEKGADIGVTRGESRHTALHLAARQGNPALVRILLNHSVNYPVLAQGDSVGDTPLHLAIMFANIDAVAVLVQYGADVNAVNNGGEAPLQRAVFHLSVWSVPECYTIMEMLVDNGAKVNARDRSGQCALHFAAFRGDVEALDRLLGYGARIDNADQDGRTALWFAARSGHCKATSFLIERGAQVNVQDYEKSALWEAIYSQHAPVIDTLLKHGANVNQLGLQGDSVLIRLIRYSILTPKVAEQLLNAWADPNMTDFDGLTALDYAKWSAQKALLHILIEYGGKASGRTGFRTCILKYKARDSLDTLSRSKFR